MTPAAPAESQLSTARYFALVGEGVLQPEDRVELLDGVIVAVSPQNPLHASAVRRAYDAIQAVVGARAVVSVQLPFIAGPSSVPEPDVAVLPGTVSDYDATHPTAALLIVEVAETSLAADRLTKAAIYAGAGVPEYWIVNLRDERVEVFRSPDAQGRRYRESFVVGRNGSVTLTALQVDTIQVDDLLPRH